MFVHFSCREIINGIVEASSIWGWFKVNYPFLVCVVGLIQNSICPTQRYPGPSAPNKGRRSLVGNPERPAGETGHPVATYARANDETRTAETTQPKAARAARR
jgi:hypothetical protein